MIILSIYFQLVDIYNDKDITLFRTGQSFQEKLEITIEREPRQCQAVLHSQPNFHIFANDGWSEVILICWLASLNIVHRGTKESAKRVRSYRA